MLKIVLFAVILCAVNAQYTQLQWSVSAGSKLEIFSASITPMPIRHPGIMNFQLKGRNTRTISGKVRSDVKITRTVSGLSVPVNCVLVSGTQVGSCVYDDLCALMNGVFGFKPETCPQNLIDNGINCKCPFNLPTRTLDLNVDIDLPDASTTPIQWIGSGDFKVTIDTRDGLGPIGILTLGFSVKPK